MAVSYFYLLGFFYFEMHFDSQGVAKVAQSPLLPLTQFPPVIILFLTMIHYKTR